MYSTPLKLEVIHIDIEASAVSSIKVLLDIFQKKGRFPYTTCSLYAYQATMPINLVHQGAPDGSVRMLYEIGVCSEKRFHASIFLQYCKVNQYFLICKLYIAKKHLFYLFIFFDPIQELISVKIANFTANIV